MPIGFRLNIIGTFEVSCQITLNTLSTFTLATLLTKRQDWCTANCHQRFFLSCTAVMHSDLKLQFDLYALPAM